MQSGRARGRSRECSNRAPSPLGAHFSSSQAKPFTCDASDKQSIVDAFAAIRSEFPDHQVKAAVFNANNPFLMRPFLDLTEDDLKPGLDLNVYGAFNFSQKVIPLLLEAGGGSLIFSGATAALRGGAKLAAFSPSKFALRSLSNYRLSLVP